MAYGLWNTFTLHGLLADLSQEEIVEVKDLPRRLTDFLQSDKVLRWFEMSTIINYSDNYIQLLDNVIHALYVLELINTFPCAVFQSFCDRRCSFFSRDWAYMKKQTPWRPK
jgi:hypothetical protein